MEYNKGIAFVMEAQEKIRDDRLFLRWVNGYQTQMSFDEFKEKALAPVSKEPELTEEETYDKVRKILERG